MKKLNNPYDVDLNMCFGCSRKNPIGLKLEFLESEEFIEATWEPSEAYMGYPNVLHGGIISALLDETGAWCVSVKAGTAGVTTSMNIKYLAPVYINKGALTLKATLTGISGNNAAVLCRMFDARSKLCAEADINFFLYPPEVAAKRFRYPGREAFYAE
jgi:uncharacterized protein (TIGR00369 family)